MEEKLLKARLESIPEWKSIYKRSNADVRIMRSDLRRKTGEIFPRLRIRFRNGVEKQISKSGYVLLNREGNRVYFFENEFGWKLSQEPKATVFTVSHTDLFHNQGDYDLHYDVESGRYFIDLTEVMNG